MEQRTKDYGNQLQGEVFTFLLIESQTKGVVWVGNAESTKQIYTQVDKLDGIKKLRRGEIAALLLTVTILFQILVQRCNVFGVNHDR